MASLIRAIESSSAAARPSSAGIISSACPFRSHPLLPMKCKVSRRSCCALVKPIQDKPAGGGGHALILLPDLRPIVDQLPRRDHDTERCGNDDTEIRFWSSSVRLTIAYRTVAASITSAVAAMIAGSLVEVASMTNGSSSTGASKLAPCSASTASVTSGRTCFSLLARTR